MHISWLVNSRVSRYFARHENKKRRRAFLRQLDTDAQDTIRRVQNCTMIPLESVITLIEAVRYVCRWNVRGSVVECGVWRGGAVMAAALTVKQIGHGDRSFYLYDTFSGMTEPSEHDAHARGAMDPRAVFGERQTGPERSNWCLAPLEVVRKNLESVQYDMNRFVIVPGKVEETIPNIMPDEISILRLDTDWYNSTRHEMLHLFPRLVPGGVLIVDDYFTWTGSRKAVDEYLLSEQVPMFLARVNESAIGVRVR